MKLKFNSNLDYQNEVLDAVINLLENQFTKNRRKTELYT